MDPPSVVEDCFGMLKLYSDGSIFRSQQSTEHISQSIPDDGSAIWKDVVFDVDNNLSLRLYKPKNLSGLPPDHKLPIIFFLRGGGFCLGSLSFHWTRNSCVRLCSGLEALVISADHRRAPENRLPAAIEDGRKALLWLREQARSEGENREEWLREGVDFDRVYVFGDSSGGTTAHHLAVELGPGSPELTPVRIRGYMLLSPFFGGVKRTKREEESPCEDFWTQEIYDRFLRLALPHGADADSPIINPFGPLSPNLEDVNLDPILVLVGGDEILKDRTEDYATRLKAFEKKTKYIEFEGKQHSFFSSNPFTQEANDVIQAVRDFISENYT